MAARFLVAGGNGNWNDNGNWSATSGGASGASFPVNGDTVTFDTASANAPMTVNTSSACTSMVVTGTYAGTLAINSTFTLAGSLTLLAGMTVTASSVNNIIVIGTTGATFTSGGIVWPCSFRFGSGSGVTLTLGDTWTILGTLTVNGNNGVTQTMNGNTMNIAGSLTIGISFTNTLAGTTNIVLNGTGSINCTANSGVIKSPVNINTSGTITFSAANITRFNTESFTYTAGTVVTTSSTINFTGTNTLTINNTGLVFNILQLNGSTTVNGTQGCTIATYSSTTAGITVTWLAGNTYTITTAITVTGTRASHIAWVSSSGGSRATINIVAPATIDIGWLDATDIDSSSGRRVWDYGGTLSNNLNWNNLVAMPTIVD